VQKESCGRRQVERFISHLARETNSGVLQVRPKSAANGGDAEQGGEKTAKDMGSAWANAHTDHEWKISNLKAANQIKAQAETARMSQAISLNWSEGPWDTAERLGLCCTHIRWWNEKDRRKIVSEYSTFLLWGKRTLIWKELFEC